MNAVYEREWRSYFHSPIGYIFVAVFTALCSFFFVNGALMYQTANLNIIFSNINIVYLFLVSILTMPLFTNERSRKTDQLLLTSPVKIINIVWGKYFAALTVLGITLFLSLIYPAILNIFGNPSPFEMLGAYIGFVLLWSSFIAIGMFISATTENQMIAAVITFGVLLVVFYMNSFAANVSNEKLMTVVRWFSLMDKYSEFETGILNISSVVYYLSFAFVFVFLTSQVIKRRQYSDTKLRINNLIVTATVIAGVILVNAIISAIAMKLPLKIDLTRNRVYEYSEQTKEVLDSLESDIQIYALYPETVDNSYVNTVREYLDRYKKMNDKIKVVYKDPYEEPAFVRQYGDDVTVGSLVVTNGDRVRIVPFDKLYRQSQFTGTTLIDAEKQLTSAIRYVGGKGNAAKVYFVKGHNEYAGADSALAAELENEGYTVDEITISKDGIPEDANLIVFLAPSVDISAQERDAMDAYLLDGGKAAFVLSPGTPSLERLNTYIAEWGISVNNDFVVENDSSRAFRSQTGVPVPAPEMHKHATTEKLLDSDIAFISPNSCGFTLNKNNTQNANVTSLLKTSEDSWGITDLETLSADKQDGAIAGPITVSAIAEKSSAGSGKVFVLGSLQAAESPGILTDSSYCNGDFILNVCSYLTEKGDALNIRAKIISSSTLTMTEQQIKIISVIIQYIIPIAVLLAGMAIWLRRRHL